MTMSFSSDSMTTSPCTSEQDDVYSFLCEISPVGNLPVCFTCCDVISDQYFLRAGEHVWHKNCMNCCVCQVRLEGHSSCFYKDGNIFCRRDFIEIFQTKCTSCSRAIQSEDWVRSAGEHVFHLACFACVACERQLSTGEDFAIHEGKVLCRTHALNSDSDMLTKKSKAKRFRTAFTDDQFAILQRHFNANPNPGSAELERIGTEAGLSKRVAKVWFQNARAKAKRFI